MPRPVTSTVRPMKISAFTSDKAQIETWLAACVSSVTNDDTSASYWFHSDSNGFGIVVSDFIAGNTGEFHLFPDGRIAAHVEHGSELISEGWHQVSHFHEFEARFEQFRSQVGQPKDK